MDKMNSNKLGSFSYTGTGSTTLGLVGLMTGSGHVGSQSYPYDHEWKYKYSDFGKTLATDCQTNCFQGEAFAAYDPCGNMISLVANSTGAEVWARAVDKNSNQAIGSYNPHAIEIPFVGDGTVMPPYEEPIVSPIAFTIGGSGFNVKDHLASNTDLTIWIGDNGANASIYGDDDCEDEMCGDEDWSKYKRCMHRCFGDCIRAEKTDYPSLDKCIDIDNDDRGLGTKRSDEELAKKWDVWTTVRNDYDSTMKTLALAFGTTAVVSLLLSGTLIGGLAALIAGGSEMARQYIELKGRTFLPLKNAGLHCGNNYLHSISMNQNYENRCREYCFRYRPAEFRNLPSSA
jgi:hypothetical protein